MRREMKMLYVVLLMMLLPSSTEASEDVAGVDPVVNPVPSEPVEPRPQENPSSPCCGLNELKRLVQEQQEVRTRHGEAVKLLTQLVQEQKEETSVQNEILKLLRLMKGTQEQQLNHLVNMARQQSLLVENHQALLFQVSRIHTELQGRSKPEQ